MNYIKNGIYDIPTIVDDALRLYKAVGGDPFDRLDQIIRKAQMEMYLLKLKQEVQIHHLKDAKLLNAFKAYLKKRNLNATVQDGVGVITKNNQPIAHFFKGTRAVKSWKDSFILPDRKGNTFYITQKGKVFDFLEYIRDNSLLINA